MLWRLIKTGGLILPTTTSLLLVLSTGIWLLNRSWHLK